MQHIDTGAVINQRLKEHCVFTKKMPQLLFYKWKFDLKQMECFQLERCMRKKAYALANTADMSTEDQVFSKKEDDIKNTT